MPKITFIEHPDLGGQERIAEAQIGQTVMEVAVQNQVPGIEAICGGSCACATCHVYVDTEWTDRVDPASEMEKSMLEFALDVAENSRLSCQIRMSEGLDGLVVRTPKVQGG